MFVGKTSNYLLIDGINACIILPVRNIINQYVSFGVLKKESGRKKKTLPIILGIILAVILMAWLIPLLEQADSGGFGEILKFLAEIFTINWRIFFEILFYLIFAIPIAAYLYGLVSGAAYKKGTDTIKPDPVKKMVTDLRFIQPATLYIVLGAVCGLYLIFIFSQTPYFFSALAGKRPDGWLIYAEYARRGFFELCGVAVINLSILTVTNITSKKQRTESWILKMFNIALAVITLVLIATALSKMALYIGAYGLSMLRLLPCVLMVFMAIVFIALIVLQKKDFSIVRFALITGAVILCALVLCNPDALVVRYNTQRYLSGTLPDYDVEILRRAGYAGIIPALEVYEKTEDETLKNELTQYFQTQKTIYYFARNAGFGRGFNEYSFEAILAMKKLETAENPDYSS
jgi:hypothetical protein